MICLNFLQLLHYSAFENLIRYCANSHLIMNKNERNTTSITSPSKFIGGESEYGDVKSSSWEEMDVKHWLGADYNWKSVVPFQIPFGQSECRAKKCETKQIFNLNKNVKVDENDCNDMRTTKRAISMPKRVSTLFSFTCQFFCIFDSLSLSLPSVLSWQQMRDAVRRILFLFLRKFTSGFSRRTVGYFQTAVSSRPHFRALSVQNMNANSVWMGHPSLFHVDIITSWCVLLSPFLFNS